MLSDATLPREAVRGGTLGGHRVGVAMRILAESCHPDLTIGLMVLLNIITLQLQQPLPKPNPIDRARGDLAERDDGGLVTVGAEACVAACSTSSGGSARRLRSRWS